MMRLNKKGFTLIELMIVLAVVAVLTAVLVPTFASVVGNANELNAVAVASSLYRKCLALDLADGKCDGQERGVVGSISNNRTKLAGGKQVPWAFLYEVNRASGIVTFVIFDGTYFVKRNSDGTFLAERAAVDPRSGDPTASESFGYKYEMRFKDIVPIGVRPSCI